MAELPMMAELPTVAEIANSANSGNRESYIFCRNWPKSNTLHYSSAQLVFGRTPPEGVEACQSVYGSRKQKSQRRRITLEYVAWLS